MNNIKEQLWHRTLKRPYQLRKIVDIGSAGEIILLIHGIGAKSQDWQPLIESIDLKKYRIISYDLLGFGVSPKPSWADYSVDEHVKSLAKSLKKDLTSKDRITIIGHSMGSIVGMHLATTHPKFIKNIILYQPPLLLDSVKKNNFRKKLYSTIASRPPLLVNFSKMISKYTDKLAIINVDDESWLPFERSMKNTILAQQTINELSTTNNPVHIVYGRLDFVISKIDAKYMANLNPKIKLHYVNEIHDITKKSAIYLKNVLEGL